VSDLDTAALRENAQARAYPGCSRVVMDLSDDVIALADAVDALRVQLAQATAERDTVALEALSALRATEKAEAALAAALVELDTAYVQSNAVLDSVAAVTAERDDADAAADAHKAESRKLRDALARVSALLDERNRAGSNIAAVAAVRAAMKEPEHG